VEAVRDEEVKLRGVGFVKQVGFKPAVKERERYKCAEWFVDICSRRRNRGNSHNGAEYKKN